MAPRSKSKTKPDEPVVEETATEPVSEETAPVEGDVAPATQEPYGDDIKAGDLPAPDAVPPADDTVGEPTGEVTGDTKTDEPTDPGVTGLSAPAAPLEAPAQPPIKVEQPQEDDDAPQPAGNLGAAMVRHAIPGSRLVDQRTGKYPDPETLFERFGPGVAVKCTVRLCQDTWIGPHSSPIRQLVMPQGQVTGPEKAEQILAALRSQIERDAAPAEDAEQE